MLAPADVLPLLLSTVIFVGLLVAATLLWAAHRSRKDAARLDLTQRLRVGGPRLDMFLDDPAQTPLGRVGRIVATWQERAGKRPAPVRFVFLCLALALGGAVAGGFLLRGPGMVAGVLLGWIPSLLLVFQAQARDQALTTQLPDALDLMTRGLRAGHAFTDALRTSSRELLDPLGEELARVSERHRLGKDLRDCLDDLLRRNPENFDLRLFCAAVMLHREAGGNLIESLENLANTIRERMIFQGKVEALTSEVRFSATVLAMLPFLVGTLILVFKASYLLPLLESPLGHVILLGGGASMLCGGLVMRVLARVEA
ncbi:hypothetical protein LBMAG42_21510 [Deltaproteobacteria bacterium]|nr:hypothetical protein LBMAG42_21510 [Deltaproteobacteria bacterium]